MKKLLTLILFACLASINFIALAQSDSTKKTLVKFRGMYQINEPLVVIDGHKQYIRGSESFKNIDPENIESVSIFKNDATTAQYGDDGKYGVISIKTKTGRLNLNSDGIKKPSPFIFGTKTSKNTPLFIYDGNVVEKSFIDLMEPSNIESVEILKGQSAIASYGIEALNGAIIIKSKTIIPKIKN